jgi:hypothetical protein
MTIANFRREDDLTYRRNHTPNAHCGGDLKSGGLFTDYVDRVRSEAFPPGAGRATPKRPVGVTHTNLWANRPLKIKLHEHSRWRMARIKEFREECRGDMNGLFDPISFWDVTVEFTDTGKRNFQLGDVVEDRGFSSTNKAQSHGRVGVITEMPKDRGGSRFRVLGPINVAAVLLGLVVAGRTGLATCSLLFCLVLRSISSESKSKGDIQLGIKYADSQGNMHIQDLKAENVHLISQMTFRLHRCNPEGGGALKYRKGDSAMYTTG